MHRLILVGSPRVDGRSAHLADELFQTCMEDCPDDGVSVLSVASLDIKPCIGCDGCKSRCSDDEIPAPPEEGDPLTPCRLIARSNAEHHQCAINDDMCEVRKHLDAADELVVVSPIYFSSAPAQLTALLDRLQPYYRSNVRQLAHEENARSAVLHVVGEGGDPHGFEPLVGLLCSALSVAGFNLGLIYDWVGKISEDGEITADADEYDVVLDADIYDDDDEICRE